MTVKNIFIKHSFFEIFIITILCISIPIIVKFNQYKTWQNNPNNYFVSGSPLMTTHDAYYWLTNLNKYQKLKVIMKMKTLNYSLLTFILSKIKNFFDLDIYIISFFLSIVLSTFFIIPLVIYFYLLKQPLLGIMGALYGSFGYLYFIRTSIGRLDTDMLNLFFPFLISLIMLVISSVNSQSNIKKGLIINSLSALCGIVIFTFKWWYNRPIFIVLYIIVFAIFCIINLKKGFLLPILILIPISYPFSTITILSNNIKIFYILIVALIILSIFLIKLRPFRDFVFNNKIIGIVGVSALFMIFFGKSIVKDFMDLYNLYIHSSVTVFKHTNTETQSIGVFNVLFSINKYPIFPICGLVSFVVAFLSCWKKMIPLLPIFCIGCVSFFSSTRFLMYLTPFIGIGYGFIILKIGMLIFTKFKIYNPFAQNVGIYVLSIVLFFIVQNKKVFDYIPKPAILPDIYSSLLDLKKLLPPKTCIFTWWDIGFALRYTGDFYVHSDGGSIKKSIVIAKALISQNQEDFHETINNIKKSELCKDNAYVLFTKDMIFKINNIHSIAINETKGKNISLLPLYCNYITDSHISCSPGSVVIDLIDGTISGGLDYKLKGASIIINGHVKTLKQYNHNEGVVVELVINNKGDTLAVIISNKQMFKSIFNQMYLLGYYNESLFNKVYNNYPYAVLYKLK